VLKELTKMDDRGLDIIRLLKKISEKPGGIEVVYVNSLLLDELFAKQFGGVSKLMQSTERTTEQALKAEAGAGLGGVIAQLFLDLKASISAEGRISRQTKTMIEEELTLEKKIALCEASLEDQGLVIENPPSLAVVQGKYLRLVDLLSTFLWGDEDRLQTSIGVDAAEDVIARWQRDQALTPNLPQVALVTPQPFCMAAIVIVQSGVTGSTYISSPPPPPKHRSVLAEFLGEDNGVAFLKTYWVIDIA
jgi:hypothetical protein